MPLKITPKNVQLIKMTDSEYFSAKYKEYISNSRLNLIDPSQGGNYRKFEMGIENKYSESFELGSIVHGLLLQPEEYEIASINKPSAKLGLFAEALFDLRQNRDIKIEEALFMASEKADYYHLKFTKTRQRTAIQSILPFYLQRMKYQLTPGKTNLFVSKQNLEKANNCLRSLNNETVKKTHKIGYDFCDVYNEFAILAELECINEDTGEILNLKIKAKIDNFVVDHTCNKLILNDLKTTGKPIDYFMGNYVKVTKESGEESIEFYEGSFTKYHYYRQLAFYLWLLKLAIPSSSLSTEVNMIVVETFGDFKSKVINITGAQLKKGIEEFQNLLNLVINGRFKDHRINKGN